MVLPLDLAWSCKSWSFLFLHVVVFSVNNNWIPKDVIMPCTVKTENNTNANICQKNNFCDVFEAALNTHQSAKKYWRLFAITPVKLFLGLLWALTWTWPITRLNTSPSTSWIKYSKWWCPKPAITTKWVSSETAVLQLDSFSAVNNFTLAVSVNVNIASSSDWALLKLIHWVKIWSASFSNVSFHSLSHRQKSPQKPWSHITFTIFLTGQTKERKSSM